MNPPSAFGLGGFFYLFFITMSLFFDLVNCVDVTIWRKVLIWWFAASLALFGYLPYIRDTFSWHTKPHVYTWFIRFLLTALSYFIQDAHGWWAGAWVTWLTAAIAGVIFILSLFWWEKHFSRGDSITLTLALLCLWVRFFLENDLRSLLLIILIESLWFYPTFRKSWYKPHEETASAYFIAWFRSLLSLFALNSVTLLTILYPVFLMVICTSLWAVLIIRRKQLKDTYI